MMKGKKKIIFLTYIPSPYRVDFFNQLSDFVDLEVVYYEKEMSNSGWNNEQKIDEFKSVTLFLKSKLNGLFLLYKLINQNKGDIFVIGGYSMLAEIFSIFYLKLLGIDFVLNSDGGFITSGFFRTILKRKLISSAKYYLSSGTNSTKTLKFYGAKPEFIFEYHFTSIWEKDIVKDIISREEKNKIKLINNLPLDAFYLTYVGRLINGKGVDVLVESLRMLNTKNLHLLVIGDGESKEEMLAKVNECEIGVSVHFIGRKNRLEVIEYLKLSDVLVLPSLSDVWGLVINEAIANGLAIISTKNTGAVYDLVKHKENGYIIEEINSRELSKAIDYVFRQNLSTMKKESIKIAQKYSIENMVRDHMILFNKLNDE